MPTPSTPSSRWRARREETAGLAEVGTSVVPLYGRHPIGVAQLARTAQSALDGRFTLGIGAASLPGGATPAWACRGTDPSPTPASSSTVCNRCSPGEQADVDGDAGDDPRGAQHHRRRHPHPAGRARTEDARARRPPGAGHDGRSVRTAHDRLLHRADPPGRGRRRGAAGATHHGADPHLRHRRRRRRLRPRSRDGDPVPGGAVLCRRAGPGRPRRSGRVAPHRNAGSASSTASAPTPRPASPTSASRSPPTTSAARDATRAALAHHLNAA